MTLRQCPCGCSSYYYDDGIPPTDLPGSLPWTVARAQEVAADERDEQCPDCEWTPSGFFAHPCEAHACPGCGHLAHDPEDGCGHPDSRTGWCECEEGR